MGSSGHAIDLKVNHYNDITLNTKNLKVVLVEENPECYERLKKVVQKMCPAVSIQEAEGSINANRSNIYLLNKGLEDAIVETANIDLGNAIFYFDPLRGVQWKAVEAVARNRISLYNLTGTEFLIFLFTSDWFLGRNDFSSLPETENELEWTDQQRKTVLEADDLFGCTAWRKYILKPEKIENREKTFLTYYKFRLHSWFRYVLPLPFTPKPNQLFHVILCSNYEAGVRATNEFYNSMTGNPSYLPGREPSQQAYSLFKKRHPEITQMTGNKRPLEWQILWKTIKYHHEGICDRKCKDFRKVEPNTNRINVALEWLQEKKYLRLLQPSICEWNPEMYMINWKTVKAELNIERPPELKPVSYEEFVKIQWRKILDKFETIRED